MASAPIRLRYPATCAGCGLRLQTGAEAHWDRARKAATCLSCARSEAEEATIDRGVAGSSAAREWERRHELREARIRERYGKLGGAVLALRSDPRSTAAWAEGARGEVTLGSTLDRLREEGMAVLHDRRIPGSRANIDHVVVSPAGVFVVDAKSYRGRVERRARGWFSTDYRLHVGGRDRTALVAEMAGQAEAVRRVLGPDEAGVPLSQAICFVGADWSLFARPLRFGEVFVLWPRALRALLRADGPLTPDAIVRVERRLALGLCPA